MSAWPRLLPRSRLLRCSSEACICSRCCCAACQIAAIAARTAAHLHSTIFLVCFVLTFPTLLRSLFFHKEMELSLIGLQNAGKTSLVNVLTTGQFHEVRSRCMNKAG